MQNRIERKGVGMAISDPQISDIAKTIIDATGLKHVNIDDLHDESQLGDEPLEMDSIDILEAVAAVEEKYKVRIVNAKEGATHFQSLKTIANFINSKSQ